MKNNKEKGYRGEDLASKYLVSKGYKILNRNFNTKIGEIDIIAKKDNILVFVEVKTRSNILYGYPYEAVNKKKQTKILKTALLYVQSEKLDDIQIRFDIIEVYMDKTIKINHIKNAFS